MATHPKARDAFGRTVTLRAPPARIVSLVPSDTFSLFWLGAGARLVGRTRYCVEPAEQVSLLPDVGGTKDPTLEAVLDLRPDLVVANQEENSRRDVEKLIARGVPVFVSFPRRVEEGLSHLEALLDLLGEPTSEAASAARRRVAELVELVRDAERVRAALPPVRVFAPIWMDPLMTVHGDTFISDVLDLCGGANVFADRTRRYPLAADLGAAPPLAPERVAGRDVRYPRVSLEEVAARAPEVVLLADEPHPFTERDADVFRALPLPSAGSLRVVFCDGKDLSWYGARSVLGLARLREVVQGGRVA